LHFEIEDTGIGIPAEQLEKIFEPFVQADPGLSRRFGGTGLGLALSRRLARSLGGDLIVEHSNEGEGTVFSFYVEHRPGLRELTEPPYVERDSLEFFDSATLKGVRVLTVDDSSDNRELISLMLERYGAHIELAENGRVGYQKALAGQHEVVLMDIQMPEMDGYSATQKLRESGYTRPIIALSAHAMSDAREKCLNVGCTAHVSKPINPHELVRTIANCVGRNFKKSSTTKT
jgi:CheY-like chemotaxis protein